MKHVRYCKSSKGCIKNAIFAVFVNKTDFSLIKVCRKVSLCYNLEQ